MLMFKKKTILSSVDNLSRCQHPRLGIIFPEDVRMKESCERRLFVNILHQQVLGVEGRRVAQQAALQVHRRELFELAGHAEGVRVQTSDVGPPPGERAVQHHHAVLDRPAVGSISSPAALSKQYEKTIFWLSVVCF